MASRELLLRILELARWAPSGDNTQPWRFEIVDAETALIHGHDTRDQVLYDFEGHASHIAHGALLETIRIAASGHGLKIHLEVEADIAARAPRYWVFFAPACEMAVDPLFAFIEKRVVQRRPMRMTPLTAAQQEALRAAVGQAYELRFFSSLADRWRVARLLWDNARIRLTCREAYAVHRDIIEWRARFSDSRIPEAAVGVDPLTARLMRWVMQDWRRVNFFNRYLMGTVLPRLELDLLPALFCAGHLLVMPRATPSSLTDWLELGRVVQRLWLTATREGLFLQPQMTPVIFRWYVQAGRLFSKQLELFDQAERLAEGFERLANVSREHPFGFFCRVGVSSPPTSRSTRLDMDALMLACDETRLPPPRGDA